MSTPPSPAYRETLTLTLHSPVERLVVEQALLLAREVRALTAAAEPGRVLERCEDAAVAQGRQLTRLALESAAQEYIDGLEKKVPRCGPVPAAAAAPTKGRTRGRR